MTTRIEWWKALRECRLSSTARHAGLTLSTYMDPDGSRCFPAQTTVARDMGVTRRTAQRGIEELRNANYLDVKPYAGPTTGGQRTHVYVPVIPLCDTDDAQQCDTHEAQTEVGSASSVQGSASSTTGQCDTGDARPSHDLPKEEPSIHGHGGMEGSDFVDEVLNLVLDANRTPMWVGTRLRDDSESQKQKLRDAIELTRQRGVQARTVAATISNRGWSEDIGCVSAVMTKRIMERVSADPPDSRAARAEREGIRPARPSGGVFDRCATCDAETGTYVYAQWMLGAGGGAWCDDHLDDAIEHRRTQREVVR